MNKRIKRFTVGQIGITPIDIPVLVIGKGKPVLGITCFVHGDESAGLFIVSRLLELLESQDRLRGTIHIVPVANPTAQWINRRVSPLDFKDLNRMGRGREDGTLTEKIGAALFELLSHCDFVINIHEFEMHTPITGVFMNAGGSSIKKQTLQALRAFSPDIVWVISNSDNDVQYQMTLDTALAKAGIPNFPIETRQLPLLTPEEIDRTAWGLVSVAQHMGVLSYSKEVAYSSPPAYFRKEVTAQTAGLWNPKCDLIEKITSKQAVGELVTLPNFERIQVFSPLSAVVVQFRHRQLVASGTGLFSLGIDASSVIEPFWGE